MEIACLDLEGVLVPEIWIAFAEKTGIESLRATTRDIPDYDVLMKQRLRILDEQGLTLNDIQEVIATLKPLDGAVEFVNWLRERFQVIILSDTFYEFSQPLMRQLGFPTLLCHKLVTDEKGRVVDYQLRQTDPVLSAADPVMRELAAQTKFDAALSVMFPGPRVIDVHRVNAEKNLQLSYGRGRPRPLFLAASPKVLLAHLPRNSLKKIYETYAKDIGIHGMGNTWQEFLSVLTQIRKDGFYRSQGELEPGLGAVAVPIFNAEGDCVAALALVGSVQRFDTSLDARLLSRLQKASAAICLSLG